MEQAYIGSIVLVGYNFAPQNWALCNGQTLSISQYQALFALIGATYGGDGMTNFALPKLHHLREWHLPLTFLASARRAPFPLHRRKGGNTNASQSLPLSFYL
jgi:Phage Tail Collar Domain